MKPRPPELEKLNYFIGTWRSEGEVASGPASPGGKLIMTERNEWMEGRFFLTLRSEFSGPTGSGTGIAYIGYDAARNVYTYDEFNSMGEVQRSIGTLNGSDWTWAGEQHLGTNITKTRFVMKPLAPFLYAFRFETSADGNSWVTVMNGKAVKEEQTASDY